MGGRALSKNAALRLRKALDPQPVCKCGQGYASKLDGLCTPCRSPRGQWITAWDVQQRERARWALAVDRFRTAKP